jgi:dTDP-4-amino-4,6-dideoxygalactose transaminase
MTSWYAKVILDIDAISEACEYFETQYLVGTREADISTLRGQRIDEVAKQLPGMVGYRYRQLQELEAIIGFLQIRELAIKGSRRKHYLEHYNRTLTPTTAEKFVEADDAVLDIALLRNSVALVRNKFLGLSKQHEYLQYQIGNLTRLLSVGVHDTLL